MRDQIFLNKGAFTVEVHTQLGNALINRKSKKDIRNHPLIHVTRIIIVMNITVRNQIRASNVDWWIISLYIFRNRKLWIRNFTVTQKILQLMRIYRQK